MEAAKEDFLKNSFSRQDFFKVIMPSYREETMAESLKITLITVISCPIILG